MVTKGYQEGVYERVTSGTAAHVGTGAFARLPSKARPLRLRQDRSDDLIGIVSKQADSRRQ
jgi:hypothetical protein